MSRRGITTLNRASLPEPWAPMGINQDMAGLGRKPSTQLSVRHPALHENRSVGVHRLVTEVDELRSRRLVVARRLHVVGLDGDELPARPTGTAGRLQVGNLASRPSATRHAGCTPRNKQCGNAEGADRPCAESVDHIVPERDSPHAFPLMPMLHIQSVTVAASVVKGVEMIVSQKPL